MFEYIKLKRFKSFGDVELNLLDRKGNPKNMILLYGENGAGKSNLASSLLLLSETLRTMDVRDFIESMLAKQPEVMADEDFTHFIKMRYKDLETLIKENKMVDSESSMYLEFGFKLNGKSGRYVFETNDSQLIHEHLEYTLVKNRGVYFDITPDTINISSKILQDKKAHNEIKTACEKFWGKHSLLSIIMHEAEDKADNFIKDQLSDNFNLVLEFFNQISGKVKFGSRQERGFIGLPHEIFGEYDKGVIPKTDEALLDKTELMLNSFFKCIYKDIEKVYYKRTYKEDNIRYKLMQTKKLAGKLRDIEFSMESTGTQSLLQLLPFMLVVTHGSTAVIDEFDTGVHDLLVQKIVKSLYSSLKGQLILTTHNTLLMESKLPKENIYVISELENGEKEIQCITFYDQKIHTKTNIRDQYLSGTYNGIPDLKDVDFQQLLSLLEINE